MASTSAPQTVVIGEQAPAFTCEAVMPDLSFGKVSLSDYAGKYLVLFAYPLDLTFVCSTEVPSFSDRIKEFEELNCAVVGWSVDSVFSHHQWISMPRKEGGLGGKVNYPLISDLNKSLSKKYNCLLGDTGHTYRALFIIDGKGVVRHATLNDAPVGRNVDEVLRLVKAFQFTDENGEVCPINWTPGSATIIPDPIKKKEYFEKVNK
eukprot:CAMPEP_0201544868 /NCGR_PEP_ID=MMETSP0173_2-20130828/1491_1 /ASSEMBLY_ACC=CAM_ASM_000268 /TAXON_ID=218659 /ORGANISM="Vexillifera sp., Strain DIVA3 564/2" /LENGTH=205 /DNA_ID=CAMNT_0047953141 /DNA_START=59 /DNA_END=676 /DNA_ORIENTATION=-